MPNPAKITFDEWKRPSWLDAEELDRDRVAEELFARESDNAKYRGRIRALTEQNTDLRSQVADSDEDAGEHDEKGAESAADSSTKKDTGQGSDLEVARLEIALEKGLTKNQAKRLVGKTREELEADADAYMEEHGLSSQDDGDDEQSNDENQGETAPPSRQPRRDGVKAGMGRDQEDGEPKVFDPSKLVDLIP